MNLKKEIVQKNGRELYYSKASGESFKGEDFISIEKKMLGNNRMSQFLPIYFQQIDDNFEIYFNIDGKENLLYYLEKNQYITVDDVYIILLEALKKIETADEYMLSHRHFLFGLEDIYYQDSIKRVEFIYLPLQDAFFPMSVNQQIQSLTKELIQRINPTIELEVDLESLLSYIENPHFSMSHFKKMLHRQSRDLPLVDEVLTKSATRTIRPKKDLADRKEKKISGYSKFINQFAFFKGKSKQEQKEPLKRGGNTKEPLDEDYLVAKKKLKKEHLTIAALCFMTFFVVFQFSTDILTIGALAVVVMLVGLNYSQKKQKQFKKDFPIKPKEIESITKEKKKQPADVLDENDEQNKQKRTKITVIVIALMTIVVAQQLISNLASLLSSILIIGVGTFLILKKMGKAPHETEKTKYKSRVDLFRIKSTKKNQEKQQVTKQGEGMSKLPETSTTSKHDPQPQTSVVTEAIAIVEEKQKVDGASVSYHLKSQPKKIELDKKIEKKMSSILKNKVFFMNPQPLLVLERFEKRNQSEKIAIHKKHFLIGRNETRVDYFENEKGTSRIHFELFYLDETVMIRDLNSKHGTFLNEFKLQPYEMYEIKENDNIKLKSVHYLLKKINVS